MGRDPDQDQTPDLFLTGPSPNKASAGVPGRPSRRYGALFWTPEFDRSTIQGQRVPKKTIQDILQVANNAGADAVAWCFPPEARGLQWKKWIYPGVVLAIKKMGKKH